MTNEPKHVCVCICTYRRPEMLRRLLAKLSSQETAALFTVSISVVDNDRSESARPVVAEFSAGSPIPVSYCVEPRRNISLARNKVLENSQGDFVALIDDDEVPTDRWLLNLFEACQRYDVDGVLGPVKPEFQGVPPKWLVEGKFHDRVSYPTGLVIDWTKGRTGNTFLKREILTAEAEAFRPDFLTGEDQDFFRRMMNKGRVFIWCDEALAYETVPPGRWTRSFLLKRALLQGRITSLQPGQKWRRIAKSLVAVPIYALALPFALVWSHARFMSLSVRLFNHLGQLLGALGINLIGEPYVTA